MFFSVDFPQLEKDPHVAGLGHKRFNHSKNDTSPELFITFPDSRSRSKSTTGYYPNYQSSASDDIPFRMLKEELGKLGDEVKQPSRMPGIPKRYDSAFYGNSQVPTKNSYRNTRNVANYHRPVPKFPEIREKKYTKMNPKIFDMNPITGGPTRHSFHF